MNSMRPALQRATVAAMRQGRGKATLAPQQGVHNLSPQSAVPPQLRPQFKEASFKETWLSDPSTYPIIVIMGCALTFMTGMGAHALAYYKDVRINPSKKHSELQTWGATKTASIVSVVGQNPYYRATLTEGLGVDHEAWVKAKAAAEKK